MEIIKIGNDAMKISLCTKEAQEYSLGDDQSAEILRNGFLNLLVNIKNGFDYHILEDKIIGEIFLGRDGGCEIFVSRVEAKGGVYRDRVQEEYIKRQKTVPSIFSFDCLDKLLTVIRRLNDISYYGASSIYYENETKKYYLFLEDVSIKDLKYAFMLEYSRTVKGNVYLHIKEHCKCICKKDVVKLLSQC